MRRSRVASSLAALACTVLASGCRGDGPPASMPGDAASAPEASALPLPAGPLVIVGGALADDNDAVYDAILARRAGDGPLCVVPTASGVAQESMASAVESFDAHGGPGTAEGIFVSIENPEAARDPEVAARLEACSGFFFTGGQQSRVVDTFLPGGDTTVAYRAVVARFRAGAVVSGSSAGAAMMSRVMIAGGSSADAVAHGVVTGSDGDGDEPGVGVGTGMDFFAPAVLDQHFLARGRIGRLLVVALDDAGPHVGFGIDENTALVVDGAAASVAGASGVILVDARDAERSGPGRGTGVRVTLAGAGDAIDLRTLSVTPSDEKTLMARSDRPLSPPEDPFARWAFLQLVVDLSTSVEPEARFAVDGATLVVARGPGFVAFSSEGEGVQGTPRGLSAGPFLVDLSP